MNRVSIFDSVTLLRGAHSDDIMGVIAEFRRRDGFPHQYTKREFNSLYETLPYLTPLVMFSENRFLLCRGLSNSYSAYSNSVFGSGANLSGPAVGYLGCDAFDAAWNDYALARKYDPQVIPSDPLYEFDLALNPTSQNKRRRSIGCTIRGNGDIYTCNSGELFPFENPEDYSHLDDGVWPEKNILSGFCGLFGWPPPTSMDYPKFIESCILYEFPPSPYYPEKPVSKKLQELALRWPWDRP